MKHLSRPLRCFFGKKYILACYNKHNIYKGWFCVTKTVEKDLIIIKDGVSFEISAMAVVVTMVDKIPYFLVMRTFNHIYDFPKGHVKVNETYLEAAIRETEEEVGLVLSKENLLTEIPGFSYQFNHETLRIDLIEFHDRFKAFQVKKEIYAYLFIVDGFMSTTPNHDEDIEEVLWVKASEMNQVLSYKNSKDLVSRVMTFLNDHSFLGGE